MSTENVSNEEKGNDVKHVLVTVCSECLQASCWQGIFMCENAINAGTVQKTKEELKQLNLEHPSYWENGY